MALTLDSPIRRGPAFVDITLAVGFVVMWSSGFIGAELGTRTAASLTVLAWRTIIGAGVLAVWRLHSGGFRVSCRGALAQVLIGALGQAGYLAGVVLAVDVGVSAGTVALIAALQPLTASVAAGPILGADVSVREWTGLIIGLVGVAMVVSGDLVTAGTAPWWGYVLPFLGMASLVAATLMDRRTASGVGLRDGLSVQTASAAVIFVMAAASTGTLLPPASAQFWFAVAWTIVFSHFGGYALYWLNVRRGGVTRVGVLLYLTPGATAVWAMAMFGQPVSGLAIAGMAVSLAAVIFAMKPRVRT